MDFISDVLSSVRNDLHPEDGACGICHMTLSKLSQFNGQVISCELPEGTSSKILDDQGYHWGRYRHRLGTVHP